MEVENTFFVH